MNYNLLDGNHDNFYIKYNDYISIFFKIYIIYILIILMFCNNLNFLVICVSFISS